MNRRDFLRQTVFVAGTPLFGGLTASFWSKLAFANSSDAPNVVVIRMLNALDGVQGINPWLGPDVDPAQLYLAYKPGELIHTSSPEIVLAPSAVSLAPFANKMALIRGIYMGPNDLGHPFARQLISSGRAQSRAPHFMAMMAYKRKYRKDSLVSNTGVESGNYTYDTTDTMKLKTGFKLNSPDGDLISNLSSLQAVQSYQDLLARSGLLDEYRKKLQEVVSQRSSEVAAIENVANAAALDEEAVAAAFASGVASLAQIDFNEDYGGYVDNHSQYLELHPARQKARWDRLANFLNLLQNQRILDNTLVVANTEFSRSPNLNMNLGKDHNYLDNSILLAGYGVNGGRAVGTHHLFEKAEGRSDSMLSGSFIDYRTGQAIDYKKIDPKNYEQFKPGVGVSLIRPRDVLRTMQEIVLPGSESQYGNEALIIPNIVAAKS